MNAKTPLAMFLSACLLSSGCAHHHHHHHEDEAGLTLDSVPTAVRNHFNHDHPNVDVRSIDTDLVGGDTHYHIHYADQGMVQDADYDSTGDEIKPDAKLP
jgi:hypothetical protein